VVKKVTNTSILRPRNLEDILGETFRVYGRNFLKLLVIVAIVEVTLGAIWIILGIIFDLASLPYIVIERKLESLTSPLIITVIVMLVISITASILMLGALIHSVVEQYRRQTIAIANAYIFALNRLVAMTGAGFLVFIIISAIVAIGVVVVMYSWIGWILLAVGILTATYFAIDWAFILPVTLMQGVGPIDSLARSSALVKRNWWRVLGIMLVVGLITAAIGSAFAFGSTAAIRAMATTGPASAISDTVVISAILERLLAVGIIIGSVLATPILAIGGTLLYYDLWIRKESY